MKRDMDLVREILLQIEQSEATPDRRVEYSHNNSAYTQEEIGYHLGIMKEANLICMDLRYVTGSPTLYEVRGLTWEGHDYLELARPQSRWEEAVKTVREKTDGISFEMLKVVLTQLTKQALS